MSSLTLTSWGRDIHSCTDVVGRVHKRMVVRSFGEPSDTGVENSGWVAGMARFNGVEVHECMICSFPQTFASSFSLICCEAPWTLVTSDTAADELFVTKNV